jgi:hypothetical protein
MVKVCTITLEVPEHVHKQAELEAEAGTGTVDDHVVDRLSWNWEYTTANAE